MLSFLQFQATRTWCGNISEAISASLDAPVKGYLYLDQLYIERCGEHWPAEARKQGEWYLILDRREFFSDRLRDLELKLWAWACSEDYHAPPEMYDTEQSLTDEYDAWTEAHGLPDMSADELIHEEGLSVSQRAYLTAFYQRWEQTVVHERDPRWQHEQA